MAMDVVIYDAPAAALEIAREFLAFDRVLNNLILTILADRISGPQAGRYWVVFRGGQAAGLGLQSPLDRPIILAAMSLSAATALATSIAADGCDLPGALGEAQLAARFAGQWMERRKTAALPVAGQRVYQVHTVRRARAAPGSLERAGAAHRELICNWLAAFLAEIGEPTHASADAVERRIAAGQFWLWNHGGARSMAAVTAPQFRVSRVQYVYTPPHDRRNGYAEALMRSLTARLLGEGLLPMLFADLGNPTSNALYLRTGYRAVAEVVRYSFRR